MRSLTMHAVGLLLAAACLPGDCKAQLFSPPAGQQRSGGPRFDKKSTQQVQVGMVVTAQGGPCEGLVGTTPIPTDWPEQEIKVIDEEFSPYVKSISYRMVAGTVKQMVVEIPFIPAGEEARALVTLEVTRHTLLPPEDTGLLVLPDSRKLPREIRPYLGPSPYIESTNAQIKSLARQAVAKQEGAWEKVEAIYDWVREHVQYEHGPLKGAYKALKDGNGDCEELSSLFIAMCRAAGIPARTVWVPDHCYPEFYLEDAEGKGYWIPCQAAGSRDFGGIAEQRPILQKGDNFTVPERPREKQRYVAEYLSGKGGTPKVRFIREFGG